VHIITKSDLILRDLDLLQQIDKSAVLPAELQQSLGNKAIVTFSFSTIDDDIAKIFEPGATLPSARLETLRKVSSEGFLTGVSMMPLLPYISDTSDSLEKMFAAFKEAGAHYVMPASITLFGNGTGDSKTLILRAVAKHYPDLLPKYQKFFSASSEMPLYYTEAFKKKMKELSNTYALRDRII
jgi:DNA repair photolyase